MLKSALFGEFIETRVECCLGTVVSVSVRENLFVSKFALTLPRCCYMTMSFEYHLEISTICLANLYKHFQMYHVASVMVAVIM